MRNFKTIMAYTIKEQVRKKSFIISNLIMIGMLILTFNIPNIMNKVQEDESNKILIVDEENIFENGLDGINNLELEYEFEIVAKMNKEDANTKIDEGEYTAAAYLTKKENIIHFEYVVKSIGNGLSPDVLKEVLSQLYFYAGIAKLNLTEEELANLNTEITYEAITTSGEEQPEFSASIILLSIALFFAIYFYAFQVSSTITTEKTSRVMETLVTSTNPRSIILGKTIGVALLGIFQLGVMVLIGIICYKVFMPANNPISWLDFSNLTPLALLLSFIYFILGYTLFAFMYALVGSTVSKPEDVQTANAPVAMISLFGFYFGYFTVISNPAGELSRIASLVPISAPFCMPFRKMMVNVPITDIILSIIILLVTIFIIINIAIRIYSSAVLHYGTKLSIKDLMGFYKQK